MWCGQAVGVGAHLRRHVGLLLPCPQVPTNDLSWVALVGISAGQEDLGARKGEVEEWHLPAFLEPRKKQYKLIISLREPPLPAAILFSLILHPGTLLQFCLWPQCSRHSSVQDFLCRVPELSISLLWPWHWDIPPWHSHSASPISDLILRCSPCPS